jgi:hypothetical protein
MSLFFLRSYSNDITPYSYIEFARKQQKFQQSYNITLSKFFRVAGDGYERNY